MAVTWHFKPGLTWGDGAPLGAADLAFTARVGRDPNSGFANTQTWARVSRVDVLDPLTAVVHLTRAELPVRRAGGVAARASGAAGVRGRARARATTCSTASTTASRPNPGCTTARTASPRSTGQPGRAGAQRALDRRPAVFRPHRDQDHRQHGGAAGQPAVRRRGHGTRRRRRPDAGPGAGAAGAASRPGSPTPTSRTWPTPHRPAAGQPDPGRRAGAPRPAAGDRPAEHGGQADGRPRSGRRQLRQPAGAAIHRRRAGLSL